MELDEHFHMSIQGSLREVLRRHIIVPDELPYLIERLMSGYVVADTAFDGFRLRIICEPDTDQGDD